MTELDGSDYDIGAFWRDAIKADNKAGIRRHNALSIPEHTILDCAELLKVTSVIEPKIKTVLDYGCGYGRMIELLKDVYDIKGYDPNAEAYNKMPDGQFDLVYTFTVLKHMNAYRQIKVMEDCYNKVKPGGVMLQDFPLVQNHEFPCSDIVPGYCLPDMFPGRFELLKKDSADSCWLVVNKI